MDKPWAGLSIAALGKTVSLFNASVCIKVGPGSTVLFWEDGWIGGLVVDSIAPAVLELVKPAVRLTRTVHQGKVNNAWALDISGQLSVDAVVQYLRLWTGVSHELQQTDDTAVSDVFRWKWTADGSYSSRGAYRALFHGTVGLPRGLLGVELLCAVEVQVPRPASAAAALLDYRSMAAAWPAVAYALSAL
jgi:hypothetical protein